MRITCDTNILVRAAMRPNGIARSLLEACLSPPHALVVSAEIIAEVRRVLGYERIQRLAKLTADEIEAFTNAIEEASDLVHLPATLPPICRDATDDPIIATAVLGRANVLCTLDRDLRAEEVINYCAMHGVRVLTDTELVLVLRAV